MDTIIGQVSISKYSRMATWAIRQVPTVSFSPIISNQANSTRRCEVCEKGVARGDSFVIHASKANATAH